MTTDPALWSVCAPCDELKPLDGARHFMDRDYCPICRKPMDIWTHNAVARAIARTENTEAETPGPHSMGR